MADITHIGELIPDARNARKHTPRNIGLIVDALHEVGAARSIVIDDEGNILAGNGTVEAAAEAGIERVQVVDADGETLVAVRRTGLTKAQKKRLALFDNRTAETAEWEPEVLAELAQDGIKLDDLWGQWELNAVLGNVETPDDPREHWGELTDLGTEANACRQITVFFKTSADVEAFAALIDQTIKDNTKSLWYPA